MSLLQQPSGGYLGCLAGLACWAFARASSGLNSRAGSGLEFPRQAQSTPPQDWLNPGLETAPGHGLGHGFGVAGWLGLGLAAGLNMPTPRDQWVEMGYYLQHRESGAQP